MKQTKCFDQCFYFRDWKFDMLSGELLLNYEIENRGIFSERFIFPDIDVDRVKNNRSVIGHAMDLLHWMAGVSYYKSGLARKLIMEKKLPSKDVADWLESSWYHGLAELAYQNNVSLKNRINFPSETLKLTRAKKLNLKARSLVPIGGGKDSLVSIESLKVVDEDSCLFMVGNSKFIPLVAKKTGLPLLQIKRQLDPKLSQLNESNVFNGHVPITAINSCVAVLAAVLYDFDSIVFSNERSADSVSVTNDDGQKVNHQYSKGFEFEQQFHKIVKRHIASDLDYFSLLRPLSELSIVKKFTRLKAYFPYFSSCNRNFHLTGSQNKKGHWCGKCPKCHFVFLCLAAFISKKELLEIFPDNFLNNQALLKCYQELLGISGIKPFECVGETEESRLALQMIAESEQWQEDVLIKPLMADIEKITKLQARQIMVFDNNHLIPNKRNFLKAILE